MKRRTVIAAALVASGRLAGSASAADTLAPPAVDAPTATALIGTALNVVHLDKELKFYVDGLGMKVLMRMGPPNHHETMLGFAGNPRQPGIILMSDSTANAAKELTMGTAVSRLVVRIANLPALADQLHAMGYTVSAVRDVAQGYRMAMATDPEGFRLELVENTGKTGN